MPVDVRFSRFVRYFVPGCFAASWIVLIGIRFAHFEDYTAAEDLLTFLHTNWGAVIGMILGLGSFVGVCLVGLDVVLRELISSRAAHLVFRFMLSSRQFRFPFLHFMDLRLMRKRFDPLTVSLLAESDCCLEIKTIAKSGSYEQKCILRETAASFFWTHVLGEEPTHAFKSELERYYDFSSMFFSISVVSFAMFVFQLIFYFSHILRDGTYIPDYLLLGLVGFMTLNLCLNRKEITKRPLNELVQFRTAKRKHYY